MASRFVFVAGLGELVLMRIYVVGMPGAGNLGDDLISVMLVQHILARWPHGEVGILHAGYSNLFPYPDLAQVSWLPMPRRRSWREYVNRLQAIRDFACASDLILIGGGGLFQDSHYRFTVHKWMRDALHTSLQRIPVAAVGVGFGPLHHAFSRWYLQQALARLSAIQVRDKESAAIVKALGYSASIAPDIVAGTSLSGTPFGVQASRPSVPVVGCSIRPWPGLNYPAVVSLITRVCQSTGSSVRLFAFEHAEPHNTSEYDCAVRMARSLEKQGIAVEVFCYRKQPIFDFVQAFSSVTMAIAVRFHANILWQKLGIPVLPISYAPKVARLYHEQGGRVISVDEVEREDAMALFQTIELSETYSLPSDEELLGIAHCNSRYLYMLGRMISIGETGYGLARSVAWRLQRLGRRLLS